MNRLKTCDVMDLSSIIGHMHDTTTHHPDFPGLFQVAVGQHGYFTTFQAVEFGIGRQLLNYHAGTGRLERAYRGVYRFRDFPSGPRDEVAAAWLAVGKDFAVVSHESALDLLDLSDIIPNAIEFTIPRTKRYRKPPKGITVHSTVNPPGPRETVVWDGFRVTSPARTIADVADSGTSPEHVERAVVEALDRGITSVQRLRSATTGRGDRVRCIVEQAIDMAVA